MVINPDNVPYVRSPNRYNGRVKPVQLIVVHTIESPERMDTAENIAKGWFAKPSSRVSAHYVIDPDSVIQCVLDSDTAWACKNANANGIQLELAGRAAQTHEDWLDNYSGVVLDNAAQVAAYICNKYRIPIGRARFAGPRDPTVLTKGLCGHADVPLHGSHTDPGVGFPWAYFLSRVLDHYRRTYENE